MRRALVLVGTLLCVTPAPARAQVGFPADVDPDAPQITTRVDRSKVQLGEPFAFTVTVVHKPDMTVNLPAGLELGEAFAELGDRDQQRVVEKSGLVRTTFVLTLGGLEPGAQTVPGIPLGYEVSGQHRQITTNPVAIEVTSVLGSADKGELRPIAPPVPVLERDWTLAWVGGGVAAAGLVALGAWLGLRARAKKRPPRVRRGQTPPPLPPAEAALARLRMIAEGGRLDGPDLRPVYFDMSEILREYVGARWRFGALEQTTEELLAVLAEKAPGEPPELLGAWLREADLVKYARVPISKDEALKALERAVWFIERTRPAVVEPVVSPVAAPARAVTPSTSSVPPPGPPEVGS